MWQAGSKKMNPGSYGYPDSVYFGVANEAQEMGGSGIEPGGATESAAINRMIQGGVENMSPLEQLVAARAQINQSQAGKDTDWLTSAASLFAEPKAKENEKGFYSDLFYRASDSNLFADAFKGAGITDYDTINKALNVTGTGDGKNVFGISPKFKFNTDDNNLFNNIYKPSESNQKAQFNVQGGDTDTNQNRTPTKGGFNGSLDRTKPFSVSPLDLSSNMFPGGFGSGDEAPKFGPAKDDDDQPYASRVSATDPGATLRKHFENRRGESAVIAAKERAKARNEMQSRNAQTMSALIAKVQANNSEVSSNVAKAHATISNLINNAARGGNAQETAGKIMQGTATTLAQPAFNRA